MINKKRRIMRIASKGILITVLPSAGFSWGNFELPGMMPLAILLTVLSAAAAVFAELMASHAEHSLANAIADANREKKTVEEALAAKDEKLRQMDRILNVLETQNHDLRAKLIIAHVRKNGQSDPNGDA